VKKRWMILLAPVAVYACAVIVPAPPHSTWHAPAPDAGLQRQQAAADRRAHVRHLAADYSRLRADLDKQAEEKTR
jgi:hypothetical protein